MIVCIGDSITYGQHLAENELAWPQLIERHEIVAAGVPSDTTRLGLERFPSTVQAVDAKAVVMQFGHNDSNRWESDRGLARVSQAAFDANLREMIDRCRTFAAVPFLCTLTPSQRSQQHSIDVAEYSEIVSMVAWSMGVELIDVRAVFGDDRDLLLDDGLHLSVMGHRVYAASVQRMLDTHWP